jgi:hypothetical protein
MIRQPYRITMAPWPAGVQEKRILTAILAALQDELAWVEKGMPIARLPILAEHPLLAELRIPLRRILPAGNNHALVHTALRRLEQGLMLKLPEVRGRKGPPLSAEILPFRMLRLPSPDRRELRLGLPPELLEELLRTSSGFTTLHAEVMMGLRTVYAMRFYEILSHWKDRETLRVTIPQIREWLALENRIPETKELMRKVILPAARLLKQRAELFFDTQAEYGGNRITHLLFRIRQRRQLEERRELTMRLREQVTNILRIRFGWKPEQFSHIVHRLEDEDSVRAINEKVGRLWHFLDQHPQKVHDIPHWSLKAVLNAMEEDQNHP